MAMVGVAVTLSSMVAVEQASAQTSCEWVTRSHIVRGIVITEHEYVCYETNPPSGATDDSADSASSIPPSAGSAACAGAAAAFGIGPAEFCGVGEAATTPAITTGLVASAFRRIPLPASDLGIQPPGGKTLVNFETNFFTTDGQPFARTLRLLGQRVELRIWAESWTWHYGDGESETTTSPGARFPDLEITHSYLAKQTYRPRVDTTYAAEWRVGNGPWQPVTGTATITGAPVGLRAIEARPTLVGYAG